MDTDLFLVDRHHRTACLAIPSLLSAYVEGRVPRIGSIMVLIGGVLVVVALTNMGAATPSTKSRTCSSG